MLLMSKQAAVATVVAGYEPGALRDATIAGNVELVQKWLIDGIDPNDVRELLANWSPLHYAAQLGHVEIIILLLDHGARPTVPDLFGETPLFQAAYWAHASAVRVLCDRGGGSIADVPASVITTPKLDSEVGSWKQDGHVTIICSAPEFSGPVMGQYPDGYQDKVMTALFKICEMDHTRVKFGYDWGVPTGYCFVLLKRFY